VATSYYTLARAFKSPPFVIVASLLTGRSRLKAKAKSAIDRSQELERENQQVLARNRQLSERLVQAEVHAERLGVASMKQGRERILSAKKRIIMVDHSCQIGDEKLMVVMGMDADNLPELGTATRRHGAAGSDAAHYAATQVKSILGKDEKFQQVISQMGTTRSQVQQIELAFLSPPTPKNKARFTNLSSIIQWMTMMLWLLRNPDAECLSASSHLRRAPQGPQRRNKLAGID